MKKRIGLFGGSFDPVTKAHIYVAEQLIEKGILDIVEFVPAYVSYHGKSYCAHPGDRIALLEEAIHESMFPAQLKVCSFEIDNKMETCTYDFVDKYLDYMDDPEVMDKKYGVPPKDVQYYFIAGGDNAKKIPNFKFGEQLIERIPFILVNRGYDRVTSLEWCSKEPHIIVNLENKFAECSSTKIREVIRTMYGYGIPAEFFRDWIDWEVFKYIMDHGLYTESAIMNRNWE